MFGEDVRLGDIYKDTITGFKGVAVAKTEWFNGCWRITLQPQGLIEGKPIDGVTFDVEQLELVKAKNVASKPKEDRTGGPKPSPSRHSAPTRR